MKGEKGKVILFDSEEEYANLMSDYLRKHRDIPWEIRTFTKQEELLLEKQEGVELLVVAESDYSEEMLEMFDARRIILRESGLTRWEDVFYVDKYQEAEEVLKVLLGLYMDVSQVPMRTGTKQNHTVFLGNYSPVRHVYQTSFALSMSQLLAREHRTLYLNFEHYAGVEELMGPAGGMDLANLLYFLNAPEEKFKFRLQTMVRHIGNLDYVPPMKVGEVLLSVTRAEWMEFLKKLGEMGEYEFIILDLSESVQGLFDILRVCTKVYTMVSQDRVSRCKLMQYEHLLKLYQYGDVLDRTCRTGIESIHKLPEELEWLTRGEMGELIKGLLRELKEEMGGV